MFVVATISTENVGEIRRLESHPSLTWLSDQVGGYVELVHCKFEGHIYSVFVNEEGILLGLTRNNGASLLYAGEGLYGNAVIAGPVSLDTNDEGTLSTEALITLVTNTAGIINWKEED